MLREYVTAHSIQMTTSIRGLSTIRLARAKNNEMLVYRAFKF